MIRAPANTLWQKDYALFADIDGQRIIYLLNPHVGHLGIFVSSKVARLEQRAILESIGELNDLAPGLYEMCIDNPTGDTDCLKPQFQVRFEERRVEDLDHPGVRPGACALRAQYGPLRDLRRALGSTGRQSLVGGDASPAASGAPQAG